MSKILYVDDHQDTLDVIARALGRSGYVITTARDMASAMQCARRDRFDLLVADIDLPDGDGLQLLARMGEMYPVRGIVLSGYAAHSDIKRAYAAGFEGFLAKPVDLKVLGDTIERVLHRDGRPLRPRGIPDAPAGEADLVDPAAG